MLKLQIWSRTEAVKRTCYLVHTNLLPLLAVKLGDLGLAKLGCLNMYTHAHVCCLWLQSSLEPLLLQSHVR